jgi:hypothetical protein
VIPEDLTCHRQYLVHKLSALYIIRVHGYNMEAKRVSYPILLKRFSLRFS